MQLKGAEADPKLCESAAFISETKARSMDKPAQHGDRPAWLSGSELAAPRSRSEAHFR